MINPLEGTAPISMVGEVDQQSTAPKPTQQQPSKPKVKVKVEAEPWNSVGNITKYGNTAMSIDKKRAADLARTAAVQSGIDPTFLFKSAVQEGMFDRDPVSVAYDNAVAKDVSLKSFPVDGFRRYGVDTFGEKNTFSDLQKKGYLPKGFENKFKVFQAINEQGKKVNTAAFVDEQSALMAKAAMLRGFQDQVDSYAKSHNLTLSPKERAYFTAASYNGGWGGGRKIMDEYISSKDRAGFIDKGLTSRKKLHSHIYPRVTDLDKFAALFK